MPQSILDLILRTKKEGTAAKDATSELNELDQIAGRAAKFGLAALETAVIFSTKAAMEAEVATIKTNAVIQSTGGIAGITAGDVDHLAQSMSELSGVDDEAIQSAENVMLTFTSIGKNVFPEAMQAALDMSLALGTDLQGAVIQVGKALQDPILGISALRRVGVNFNTTAKETIQMMVDTGDAAGAQAFILKELETEFGGIAKAMGDTTQGSLNKMLNAFENLGEAIGNTEIAGRSLISWLGDAADTATLLMTKDKKLADAEKEHELAIRKTFNAYEDYLKEMVRVGILTDEVQDMTGAIGDRLSEEERQLGIAANGWVEYGGKIYDVTNIKYLASRAFFEATRAAQGETQETRFLTEGMYGNAKAAAELVEAQRPVALSAEDIAKAEEDAAKAIENARNAAINAKMDFYGMAGSLMDTKDKSTITREALSQLEAMARGGGLSAEQLSSAYHSAGIAAGLFTKESLAMTRGVEMVNKLFAEGRIGPEQYTEALKRLPDAAKDGIVTLSALGLKVAGPLKKSAKELYDETGGMASDVATQANTTVSKMMLSIANVTRTTKNVAKGDIQEIIEQYNKFGTIPDIHKYVYLHVVQVGEMPSSDGGDGGPAGDQNRYTTNNNINQKVTMIVQSAAAASPDQIARRVIADLGRITSQTIVAGAGMLGT